MSSLPHMDFLDERLCELSLHFGSMPRDPAVLSETDEILNRPEHRVGELLKGEKIELGRGKAEMADGFTYQTTQLDVFVVGDVYTGPKFAIDAIAVGKQAAHVDESLCIGCGVCTTRCKMDAITLRKKYKEVPVPNE